MRTITGILLLPDNTPIDEGVLTFIATETYQQVLQGTTATTPVSVTGAYSVTLRDGRYSVQFNNTNESKIYLGVITVTTGADISLDDLLVENSGLVSPDVRSYVDDEITTSENTAATLYQDIGDYLGIDYDNEDTPTTPTGLVLTSNEDNTTSIPAFSVKAEWNASTNVSGNSINYKVTYYTDADEKITVTVADLFFEIPAAVLSLTYTVEVSAVSAVNSNLPSPSYVSGQVVVTTDSVPSIDTSTLVVVPGLLYLVLRWGNPVTVPGAITHIYAGSVSDFTVNEASKVYSGIASTYIHHTDDINDVFFKFITENRLGVLSLVTTSEGPYNAYIIDDSTIDDLIEDSAIAAQHIANGAITHDKILANTIATSRLAVLDLTNLCENNNFSLITGITYDSWEIVTGALVAPIAIGSANLTANSVLKNLYTFACNPETKLYGSVKVNWAEIAGAVNKGLYITFVDIDDVVISSAYITVDTSSAIPGSPILLEDFIVSPLLTAKAYLSLKVEATTAASISFSDVVCRYGSAVLIEDGEITADKLLVDEAFMNTLYAIDANITGELTISSAGLIKVGDDPGVTGAGLIFSATSGIQAFNTSNVLTFDLDPTTGDAYFAGALGVSTLAVGKTITAGGNIILNSIAGQLKTINKDSYNSSTDGIFIGYDTDGQKVGIGTNTDGLQYDGSALRIIGSSAQINLGDFTGWDFPATGGAGAHMSSLGFRAGNFIDGTFVTIQANGDIVAPGFTITGGTAAFSGNISASTFILGTTGNIHSTGKDTYADNTAGVFLGYDAGAYKVNIGDGTNNIKWTGSALISAGAFTCYQLAATNITVPLFGGYLRIGTKASHADTNPGTYITSSTADFSANSSNYFRISSGVVAMTGNLVSSGGTVKGYQLQSDTTLSTGGLISSGASVYGTTFVKAGSYMNATTYVSVGGRTGYAGTVPGAWIGNDGGTWKMIIYTSAASWMKFDGFNVTTA